MIIQCLTCRNTDLEYMLSVPTYPDNYPTIHVSRGVSLLATKVHLNMNNSNDQSNTPLPAMIIMFFLKTQKYKLFE